MTTAVIERNGTRYVADLADPLSIAIPLDFDGAQPNHFGAAPAHAAPLTHGRWIGEVLRGGTVNCDSLALIPHCNGTHTECVGHLTEDRVAINDVLRGGLYVARLITVRPVATGTCGERIDADSAPDESVITAAALAAGLRTWPGTSEALVIRTLPNEASKLTRAYSGPAPAPYLTADAAAFLVEAGVRHLVTDLPSLDRAEDQGRLQAHRIFWGLTAPSRHSGDATRPQATVTELAWIAPMIRDGWYLLDLQIPAFVSDASPSRPLLYPLRRHD
jgi:kynurenine formamidase